MSNLASKAFLHMFFVKKEESCHTRSGRQEQIRIFLGSEIQTSHSNRLTPVCRSTQPFLPCAYASAIACFII